MNNEPMTGADVYSAPPRRRALVGIGAAAGYLGLYFGIRFALSLFVTVVFVLLRSLPDLEMRDDLLSAVYDSIADISFVEIICSTIAFFAAVWVVGLIRDRRRPMAEHTGFFRDTGFVRFRPTLIPVLLLLGFSLNLFVSLMFDILPIPDDLLEDYASQTTLLGETTMLSVLATAIFAPLSEELVFRGMMISRLRRAMPVWAAALIPSAIFGLIHGQILWICYAFLLGLYLSMVCIRAESTAASALLHAAFNASSFILPFLPIADDAPPSLFYALAAASGAVSVLLTAVLVMLTKKKPTACAQEER